MNKEERFSIQGMHCASCVHYIESQLSTEPGVKSISVNLIDETCNLTFDDTKTNLEKLNSKISSAGYLLTPQINSTETINSMSTMDHGSNMNSATSNQMSLEMKIGLVLTALSFAMIAWESAIQLSILPEMNSLTIDVIHHIMPIAATFMLLTQGRQYLKAVGNFIKSGHANMDTLTGIGISVAYIYSFIISAFEIPLTPYIDTSRGFYDVVIILIGLIGYGKFIESKAKKRTTDAIRKLVDLTSKSALVKIDGKIIKKDISEIMVGDIVVIKVGMSVPVDGLIIGGEGMIDESSISGESMPVAKEIKSKVYAGTILKNGYIEVLVKKIGKDTKLGRITKMVENAMNSKAPIQKLADIVSSYFTKIVLIIAISTAIAWIIYGFYSGNFALSIRMSVTSFVSILIVACPCALGLATPLAIAKGVGEAAKNGILFKNAESIQKIQDIDVLIFDKTGTLTNGKFEIIESQIVDNKFSKVEVDSLMYALESKSNHQIASIFTKVKPGIIPELEKVNISNNGVSAEIDKSIYKVGNAKYIGIESSSSEIGTHIYLTKDDKLIAKFVLMDQPKANTKEILQDLRSLNIKTVLATGDKKEIAMQVGQYLGFNDDEIFSELQPEEKLGIIEKLHSEGKTVAMFGDGINDSPALAKADVGVAMGNGAEIALETADVAILNGDLSKLPEMFELSRITFRNIKQNLFWAFSYNFVMIPIATGIFYIPFGLLLSPIFDGISMSFSSIAVVINSSRIKLKKK